MYLIKKTISSDTIRLIKETKLSFCTTRLVVSKGSRSIAKKQNYSSLKQISVTFLPSLYGSINSFGLSFSHHISQVFEVELKRETQKEIQYKFTGLIISNRHRPER